MPVVSAIIPTYNMAAYLNEAIKSVLSQSLKNFELIVVDDGSTDETAEIVAAFNDSRIRYRYQENQGLGAARNCGIQVASAPLIALLDADDLWMPTFLALATDRLTNRPDAGVAYGGFQYMDEAGQPLPTRICRPVDSALFPEKIWEGNWLSASCVVLRTNVVKAVGLFDADRKLGGVADYDMWLRLADRCRFVGVPEILAWYRRSGRNMSDDVDYMLSGLESLFEKHLGSLEPVSGIGGERQLLALSQLHRKGVQEYLAHGRLAESAERLRGLCRYDPERAVSFNFWYSLACVHQGVGLRGDFESWDGERAYSDLLRLLGCAEHKGIGASTLKKMRGQALHALAALHYGKRQTGMARHYLLSSVRCLPELVVKQRWLQLALRLVPGAHRLRAWYGSMRS